MAAQGQQFLAAVPVPHLRCLVITAGGEALAIGAKGHTVNRAGVAAQGEQFLAALPVPNLRRLVIASVQALFQHVPNRIFPCFAGVVC